MIIKQLSIFQLPSVIELITCTRFDMQQNKIYQWDETYPNKDIIENDILQNHGFGLFDNGILAGYFVLDEIEPAGYKSIKWKIETGKKLYIHRFCINPFKKNNGYAQYIIKEIEKFAVNNAYMSIRIDAFCGNKMTQYLYENSNFDFCGSVKLTKGEYICYEKIVNQETSSTV